MLKSNSPAWDDGPREETHRSPRTRLDILGQGPQGSGQPEHVLEQEVWAPLKGWGHLDGSTSDTELKYPFLQEIYPDPQIRPDYPVKLS